LTQRHQALLTWFFRQGLWECSQVASGFLSPRMLGTEIIAFVGDLCDGVAIGRSWCARDRDPGKRGGQDVDIFADQRLALAKTLSKSKA